jgi:hypothetical protein
LPEERVRRGEREKPEERVQETHVEEVEAAEELAELAPADEEERRPVQVRAEAERIDSLRMCRVPRGGDDLLLVRADLDGPAVQGRDVQRSEGEDQPSRHQEVFPLNAG